MSVIDSSILLTAALNNLHTAVVIADATKPDMPLVLANRMFCKMTGYSKQEVLGRNCRFMQGDDRGQPGALQLRKALTKKTSGTAMLKNYRKDGTPFMVDVRIDPVAGPDEKVSHFVASQRPIIDQHFVALTLSANQRYRSLTKRESETFELVVNGFTTREIAENLSISIKTAEKHRAKIYRKFETNNLSLLVRYGIVLDVPFHL